MNRNLWKALALAAVAGAAPGAMAQTDALYMVDAFSSGNMYVSQGGALINSWKLFTGAQAESPVAVASTVRTMGYAGGIGGAEYTLGGAWTGNTYVNPTGYGSNYDGTTDGSRNYSVDYSTGDVIAGNTDWTGMGAIFNVGFGALGITYDQVNGTLWTSNYANGTVDEWSMSGSLMTSFASPMGPGRTSALAYEPSTDSLWLHDYTTNNIFNLNKSGGVIGTVAVSGLPGNNLLSMEFAIPAPSSLALIGLGGLAAARRRRN